MLSMPKVLLLTGDEEEVRSLREILGQHALLSHVRSVSETQSHLERHDCDIVFCAWAFFRDFWHADLQEVRERYPDLPVVVLSRTGGEREWLEVLDAGAFDLLVPPYCERELLPAVEHAVASYEARVRHNGARRAPKLANTNLTSNVEY